MEQGKKKLISGADEFVKERKDQLEKERQQQENAQKEKGQQDQEFHKTQAQQNEQFLKNEQHMTAERARLNAVFLPDSGPFRYGWFWPVEVIFNHLSLIGFGIFPLKENAHRDWWLKLA